METQSSSVLLFQFSDGALFAIRTVDSGVTMNGDQPANFNEAASILTFKAQSLFALEVMGRC